MLFIIKGQENNRTVLILNPDEDLLTIKRIKGVYKISSIKSELHGFTGIIKR